MRWLISTALRQRVLVIMAAIAMLVWGARTARETSLDVFPEFAPPTVEVQTEAPGLSTEEVESLVTMPLENALNGMSWLRTIRSKSVLGLSSVVLLFEQGTDLFKARQAVAERLPGAAGRLPVVAKPPVLLQPLSSMSRAMKVGISSRSLSQLELTDLARWTIRPRLMAVRGVANVAIWGERDRQLQILVDPDRLRSSGITLDQVERTAGDAVALAAGGFINTPNQRLAVRHLSSVETAEDLARAVVAFRGGAAVRVGDVAEVTVGHAEPIGDAVINDGPGLLLIVEKYPWGNTLQLTRDVEAALESLKPGLAGVEVDSTIFRPATFIERSLDNLGRAMLLGCILVAMVLAAFLADWRTALISMTAIPVSLLTAAVALHLSGWVVNTMVLAGLVIATGEVVDDAIIDVENVSRRLRARSAVDGPSAFEVVLGASIEVRSAVVIASLIVVLVFVPVFFLDGLAGSFFRPLALSYVLAISASLLVALTVTPALCLVLLPGAPARGRDSPLVRGLKRFYRIVLPPVTARPWTVAVTLAACFVFTGMAYVRLGEEFLPRFKETDFLMHWVEKPGTSLDAMRRITERVSRELRSIPGVRNFGSHLGRAEAADEVVGTNFTELWISVDPSAEYDATVSRIQAVIDGYPGLYRDVLTYLKERIKEVLTGASATVVVRTFGDDLEILRAKAREIARGVEDIAGVADLKVEPQVLVPQVTLRLRADAADLHGLTPGRVRQAAETLVKGRTVGQVYDGQKVVDVVVWGVERVRGDVDALRSLPIDTPGGGVAALGDVAGVEIVPSLNEIKREGASRRIDVTCNIRGRDLGAVAREVEGRVRAVPFEHGYHAEVLGEYAARAASHTRLLSLALAALAGIALVLHADLRSLRLTLLVLLTLPFALIGGVLAAYIGGGVLSLGSLIGFVTVLGIAARNGILLVSHYRHLEQVEGEQFSRALIQRGAEERLVPILMTALCAGLALVPLVAAGDVPGHEIEHPMAVVILGGLVTSTALNVFFLPALYTLVGKKSPGERA